MTIFSCFLDEGEDGEADLHQCGSCKEMFTNLSSYIMHKIEKPCRGPSRPPNHGNENEMEADEEMHGKDSPGANKRMKVRKICTKLSLTHCLLMPFETQRQITVEANVAGGVHRYRKYH